MVVLLKPLFDDPEGGFIKTTSMYIYTYIHCGAYRDILYVLTVKTCTENAA